MMNLTDYLFTGGAILTWWVIPIMLIVGFLTPWPYNYWRLKKFGLNPLLIRINELIKNWDNKTWLSSKYIETFNKFLLPAITSSEAS